MPQLADDFFDRIAGSLSSGDLSRVSSAWLLAKSAHSGQSRQSGEPYETHPLAVASLLFELLGSDADALCAALLHDVVEDSDTPLSSIAAAFGPRVARVVDGVSKLDQIPAAGGGGVSKDDTLRKLVAAGGRDWRVFAVKLCDRLHNMRTLSSVSRMKQYRVAAETRLVYVPLANYVGFLQIAAELRALSLRWLYPWRWIVVEKWVRYKVAVDRLRLQQMARQLDLRAATESPLADARVSNALMIRGFDLLRGNRAHRSLFAVPVVYELYASIDDAYQQCARLHRDFALLPATFSSQASEGVVTSKILLAGHALVVECVFFFPRVARSEASFDITDGDDFAAMAATSEHPGDFTRVLRDLVEHTSIAVFSPGGRCLSLPAHACGLDFAFAIHTDIGLRATAVRVNGRLCDARAELVSGDVVEVVTSETIVAKPEWEVVLRSPRARAKLRHWLREASSENAAALGVRLIADALGSAESADIAALAANVSLLNTFGCSSSGELFRKVGSGELSAFAVAAQARGTGADQLLRSTNAADERSRLALNGGVYAGIEYCEFCMPVPGDAILATGSYSGVKIHRVLCPKSGDNRGSAEFFSPMWVSPITRALPTKIRVECRDRRALLADCARAVSDCGVDVIAVNTHSELNSITLAAVLEFTVQVRSLKKLDACVNALRLIDGVRVSRRVDATDT